MRTKPVGELKIGDRTPWYEIVGTPYEREDDNGTIVVIVPIRYVDGDDDARMFSPGTELEITDEI